MSFTFELQEYQPKLGSCSDCFCSTCFFDLLRYNPDDEVKPQVALKEEAVAQEEELQEITQQEKDEKPAAPVEEPAESSGKRDEQQDKDQANKGKQPAEDQGQAGKPAVDQEEKGKQHGGERKASALAEPIDLSNEQVQDVLGKLPAHILPPDVVCFLPLHSFTC